MASRTTRWTHLRPAQLVRIEVGVSVASTYFPHGTLAEFYADWFRTHLRALNEPRLHSLTGEMIAYRFLWLRTFDEPIAIRARRENDQSFLHAKQTSGEGGFEPGTIAVNTTRKLADVEWGRILAGIDEIGFWKLPSEASDEGGLDGAEWVIEGFDCGRYHVVHRWTDNALASIAPFGLLLLELSGLRIKPDAVY